MGLRQVVHGLHRGGRALPRLEAVTHDGTHRGGFTANRIAPGCLFRKGGLCCFVFGAGLSIKTPVNDPTERNRQASRAGLHCKMKWSPVTPDGPQRFIVICPQLVARSRKRLCKTCTIYVHNFSVFLPKAIKAGFWMGWIGNESAGLICSTPLEQFSGSTSDSPIDKTSQRQDKSTRRIEVRVWQSQDFGARRNNGTACRAPHAATADRRFFLCVKSAPIVTSRSTALLPVTMALTLRR